jgi:hypothetical protein
VNPADFDQDTQECTNTPEEIKLARRVVEQHSADPNECRDLLMMLGIEPADFVWLMRPGRRGTAERVKLTLDGAPYPEGKTPDARTGSSTGEEQLVSRTN